MNIDKEKKILMPDGKPSPSQKEKLQTERSIQRVIEENKFVPVIIKRNDETIKHPDDILEIAIREGKEQIDRPFSSLLLSSISAGLILSFAAMAVGIASTLISYEVNPQLHRLAIALVYPIGFIICILSGTQLFTEHTALAVYPVLDEKGSFFMLLKSWIVVLSGNLLGTAIGAFFIYMSAPVTGSEQGYLHIAEHLMSFTSLEIFVSGILAGWLMALGGWLVLSSSTTTGQIMCIYFVTFLIGIGGLHHSIAGSAEVFLAKYLDTSIANASIINFLTFAVLGNIIGGSFFVAILNYGHIRKTQIKE